MIREELLRRLTEKIIASKVVIFDMDGTLLDSEVLYYDVWRSALSEQGLELSKELYSLQCAGRTTVEGEEALLTAYGEKLDIHQFRLRWPVLWNTLLEREGISAKDGAQEFLSLLHNRGKTVALATSSTYHDMKKCMEMVGWLEYFKVITTGNELPKGRGKPFPDIFLLTLTRLGCTADEAIIIEDSEAGVRAAAAAGVPCIMIPDLKPPSAAVRERAEGVIQSLQEIVRYLS